MTNPAIEATAPTDRSMPPVSIVSVWQAARIASGHGGAQDRRPAQFGADDARLDDLEDDDERDEQDEQRDDRLVAEQAGPGARAPAVRLPERRGRRRSCAAPPDLRRGCRP